MSKILPEGVFAENTVSVHLFNLTSKKVYVLFGQSTNDPTGHNQKIIARASEDGGKSWPDEWEFRLENGDLLLSEAAHNTLVSLPSGKLGLLESSPRCQPGYHPNRPGPSIFHTSSDQGRTWSKGVVVERQPSLHPSGTLRLLRTGRLIAPMFTWISVAAGPEAECADQGFAFSYCLYSDDEGQTWQRSRSELFISIDKGLAGNFQFEEPCLEELKDGRLLLYGRTELGLFYETFSSDGGETWTKPEPIPGIAAAYAPPFLKRIPQTGDLLLIWNQATRQEALEGLSRHRLTCAISDDEGKSWKHRRNLESLDDLTSVEAPLPDSREIIRMITEEYGYFQPEDTQRYPHAPGFLRVCYPNVAFVGERALVAYDYGYGPDAEATYRKGRGQVWAALHPDIREIDPPKPGVMGLKLKVLPLDWFYEFP